MSERHQSILSATLCGAVACLWAYDVPPPHNVSPWLALLFGLLAGVVVGGAVERERHERRLSRIRSTPVISTVLPIRMRRKDVA